MKNTQNPLSRDQKWLWVLREKGGVASDGLLGPMEKDRTTRFLKDMIET